MNITLPDDNQLRGIHAMSDKEFLEYNETALKMNNFSDRSQKAVEGKAKFVLGLGPQGIGKTSKTIEYCAVYREQVEARWRQQHPLDRNPRRTRADGINIDFRSPISPPVSGHITPIKFYLTLMEFSHQGEIVVIDDMTMDSTKSRLLHQATDVSNRFRVSWDRLTDIVTRNEDGDLIRYPLNFNFNGTIILAANAEIDTAVYNTYFPRPLRDRGQVVNFPYKVDDRYFYTMRMSLLKGGIMKYLANKIRDMTYTLADVEVWISDVTEFYWTHRRRATEPSFRLIERIMSDRIDFPNDWRIKALDHFN